MENLGAIICPTCNATLTGDTENCPFCNTQLVANNSANMSENKIQQSKIKFDKYNLPSFEEIKNKTFSLFNTTFLTVKKFIKELPNNLKTKPSYLVSFSLISFCLLIILLFIGNAFLNNIGYQKVRSHLLNTEVETITIEKPNEKLISNMLPVDNKQSIYENNDCSMFQYESINKENENEKCIVSVYIQPLTNLLDRRVYNNFGSITTDAMTITMSVENSSKYKAPIDLLFFDKKTIQNVERLNNFLINDIEFQSYKLNNKFYLVAHLQDDYYLTYQATMKDPQSYENFNQIFHIIFAIDIETEKK